jgi:hypothetical protein
LKIGTVGISISTLISTNHNRKLSILHRILVFPLSGFLILISIYTLLQAVQSYQNPEVLLTWKTASELNTAGFNILRGDFSDRLDGRINSDLIPASLTPVEGGTYRYHDTSVIPGKTYYYTIEEVELDGTVNRYDPIQIKARREGVSLGILSIGLLVIGIVGTSYGIYLLTDLRGYKLEDE